MLDFHFRNGPGPHCQPDAPYLQLLDIRMPEVDGVEVLRRIKQYGPVRKMPIIMLTTSDPKEIVDDDLGCG